MGCKKILKLGCGFILALFVIVVLITINSVKQPGVNAGLVREQIKPGMNAEAVQEVLQSAKGRNFYYYYVQIGEEEEACEPDEFLQIMNNPKKITGQSGRIWLVFMSNLVPFRVSFSINFGPDGKVASLTQAEGWD